MLPNLSWLILNGSTDLCPKERVLTVNRMRQPARVNVKALIILVVVVGVIGVGVVVGHHVRKRIIAREALAAGTTAFEREDWTEACKQLKLYLSKYPRDVDVLEKYARAHLSVRPLEAGNIGGALGAYRALLRFKPGDQHVCRELIKLYYGLRDFDEAAYIARQRLAVDPSDAEAKLWLGRTLVAQHKQEKAHGVLRQLVTDCPDQVDAYRLLSEIAAEADTLDAGNEARRWLDQAVEANPQSALARVHRARFLRMESADSTGSREDLQAADALNPSDPGTLLALAEEWMALGELDRAHDVLAATEAIDPDKLADFDVNPGAFALARALVAGRLALLRGDAQNGARLARETLDQLSGRRRDGFLPMAASLLLAGGDVDGAREVVEAYREALALRGDPGPQTKVDFALVDAAVADAEGRHYAVIGALEDLVVTDPERAEVWRRLWLAYDATGQPHRAIRALEEYVSRRSSDRVALLALATSYRNRDWRKTWQCAERAQALRPDDLEARLLGIEARLYGGTGLLSAALGTELETELRMLLDRHQDSADIHLLLAGVAHKQGRTSEAFARLEAAVAISSDPSSVRLQIVRLHALNQDVQKAIDTCVAIVEEHPDRAAPRIALARLLLGAGQADRAHETLAGAREELVGNERVDATYPLASYMLSHGDPRAGVALLEELAADRPGDVRPRLLLLAQPSVTPDAQRVQQLISELRSIEGERGLRWRFEQARHLLRRDDWREVSSEAEGLLQRCVEADPDGSGPVLALGRMYEMLGREGDAERVYRRTFESSPGQLQVAGRLLALLERQRRFAETEATLNRLPDNLSGVRTYEAQAAIDRGEPEFAVEGFGERIAVDGGDATSRVVLARLIYRSRRDAKQALELLEEAAALDPDLSAVLSSRASILHAEGRGDEAVALLDAEVDRRGDFASHQLRAAYYAATRQPDLAEPDYVRLTQFADSAADGFMALGAFYQSQGRVGEAMEAWERGLTVDEDHVGIKRHLSQVLLSHAEAPSRWRGREMLDGLLERFPEDAQLLSVQAGSLLREGAGEGREQAKAILQRIVQIDPRRVTAHLQLVNLARREGKLEEARERIIQALAYDPRNVELLLTYAGLEADMDNPGLARRLARSVLDLDPDNLPARNLLAAMALRDGEIDAARDLIEEVLRRDPSHDVAHVTKASIHAAEGRLDQAVESLEAYCVTDEGAGSLRALLALAELHRGQGDMVQARERVDEAERLSPGNSQVFLERLRWFHAQGLHAEVHARVTERRAEHPGDVPGLVRGAWILLSSGEREYVAEAKSLFEHVVAVDRDHVDAHLGLAHAVYQIGDVEAAVRVYRRALALEPYHRQGLNDLAWILAVDLRRAEEALELADTGLARYPDDPHLLDTRGVILLKLDRPDEARRDLERCVETAGKLPATRARAMLHLARHFARQDDRTAVRSWLDRAMEIDRAEDVFDDEERAEIAALRRATGQ